MSFWQIVFSVRYEWGFTCVQFSDLEPVHVSFVMVTVTKRQVLIPALRFSSVNIIPPALYTYLHLHDILKRKPIGLSPKKAMLCRKSFSKVLSVFFPLFKGIIPQQDYLSLHRKCKTYLCLFARSSCRLLSSPLSTLVSLFKLIIFTAVVIKKMLLHKSKTPTGP